MSFAICVRDERNRSLACVPFRCLLCTFVSFVVTPPVKQSRDGITKSSSGQAAQRWMLRRYCCGLRILRLRISTRK